MGRSQAGMESRRARDNASYSKDPTRMKANAARWAADNPKRKAWTTQKFCAKRRGIEFTLTLEQFIEFWGSNFHLRGNKKANLCMGRYGDTGAYEVGNIYRCTNTENNSAPRTKEDLK